MIVLSLIAIIISFAGSYFFARSIETNVFQTHRKWIRLLVPGLAQMVSFGVLMALLLAIVNYTTPNRGWGRGGGLDVTPPRSHISNFE